MENDLLPEHFRKKASKSWQTVVPFLLVVVMVCFITGWSRTTAARDATLPVDPDLLATVYGAPVDTQKIISFKDDKFTVRIAADQLVVTLKPGKTPADARSLADFLGGAAVIGQVPRQRVYQLRVTARGKEELDALLTRARSHPDVHRAGYNSLVKFQSCPAQSDNHRYIHGRHRCAFEDIEYYTALTLFDAARDNLTLSPVGVAVLDTGLSQSNSEFMGLNIINLDEPGTPLMDDTTYHGTQVTGLIAANDDNYRINGIASRFLERNLTILFGEISTGFDVNVMIERAFTNGANIVNMSFTIDRKDPIIANFLEVFEKYPDILFLAGLPAYVDPTTGIIFERIAFPAGIGLDNVVTVGGMHTCKLAIMDSSGSKAALAAEIRAPAEDIPVLRNPKHADRHPSPIEYEFGISYAIPLVSSLAAILKSLKPSLTPREIKFYLQQRPMLFGPQLTFRLAMLRSIAKLLLDMNVGPPVRNWIDPGGGIPPPPVPPGMIMGNVCGEAVISVAGAGDLRPNSSDLSGGIDPNGSAITFRNIGPEMRSAQFIARFPLGPGTYALVEDTELSPQGVQFNSPFGRAISGTLIISDDCWITQRFPITNEPVMVNLSGRFNGVLEKHGMQMEFEGHFTHVDFGMRTMKGHFLLRDFENRCACGIGP